MKLHRHLIAWSLALAAGPGLAADTPRAAPSVDLAKARALIEQKHWAAAICELERLARRDRSDADAQNLLGCSLRNAGQIDKAFTAYNHALRLAQKHKAVHGVHRRGAPRRQAARGGEGTSGGVEVDLRR